MEIGTGRFMEMGANMATRLLRGRHRVVVYDINEAAIQLLEGEGAEGVRTLAEIAAKIDAPRSVWVIV
jgi:6-phosphogluconate dehydrogenase